MIFKTIIIAAIALFIYIEVEILRSSKLTNGEKLSSLVCFLLVELFYLISLVVL